MKLTGLALSALLLSGCYLSKAIDDSSWDPELLKKIEVGKTTKSDLLQHLGPPKQIVRLLDSEAYMYTHSVEKETGAFMFVVNTQRNDKQFDAITVIVDRQGVVSAVGSRFAADNASYGMPWGD